MSSVWGNGLSAAYALFQMDNTSWRTVFEPHGIFRGVLISPIRARWGDTGLGGKDDKNVFSPSAAKRLGPPAPAATERRPQVVSVRGVNRNFIKAVRTPRVLGEWVCLVFLTLPLVKARWGRDRGLGGEGEPLPRWRRSNGRPGGPCPLGDEGALRTSTDSRARGSPSPQK